MKRTILWLALATVLAFGPASAQGWFPLAACPIGTTIVYLTSASNGTPWTVGPCAATATAITVETIGGGGAAGWAQNGVSFGGGGCGGAYSYITGLTLTVGASITFNVGAAGVIGAAHNTAGGGGGDTWFNGASLAASSVGAKGAGGGQVGLPAAACTQALASAGIGTTKFSGGIGGSGNFLGAGGGAAGPHGAGANGGTGSGGVNVSGGGGGGTDGGTAGGSNSNVSTLPGGAGGNNFVGSGGGAGGVRSATPGAGGAGNPGGGGGGGGGNTTAAAGGAGGAGGAGAIWDATHGPGGGGGTAGNQSSGSATGGNGGNGGLYGGGGGANGSGTVDGIPGAGGAGLIIITYTRDPSAGFTVALTIPNSDAVTFTAQPIPLRITSVDINWSHVRVDGGDIRVTEADGVTAVPYYFQVWDYAHKLAVIWAKPASIGPSGNTTIDLKYGNPSNTVTTASYDNTFAKVNSSTSGLLALHHFDEGSGTTSADALGTYPATLVGTPSWTAGDGGNFRVQIPTQTFASGSSIILNGTSQYISIPTLLDTQGNTTVSLWVNPPVLNANNAVIWNKTNDANNFVGANFTTNGAIGYSLSVAGTALISPTVNGHGNHVLPLNRPSLVTFTYGSGGFRAYVDGEADLILPAVTSAPGNGTTGSVRIGATSTGTNFGHFTVDEHAVFNRQLAEWEIVALFERRPDAQIKDAFSKLVNAGGNPIITNGTDEILESNPIVVTAGSSYQNYIHDNTTNKLLYYTSTNGVSWTLVNSNVLTGTPAADSPSVWVDSGGTYHLTVNIVSYTAGNLSHYTSPDGVTWTKQADILTTGGIFTGFYNASSYYPPSGGIEMIVEYRLPTGNYVTGLWSGSSINSLVYQGDTSGLVYGGGPDIHNVGSKFIVLNHGSLIGATNSIPTLGQAGMSTNLQNFIDAGIAPGIQLHGPVYKECDQVADLFAVDNYDGAGNLAVYWTGDTDTSTGANCTSPVPTYALNMATFAGTFAQWVTDNLTPVFGTEH